jgi:BirA family biotin operon repressor/biotin-[acetyl-CoA-carboxylase] ligase
LYLSVLFYPALGRAPSKIVAPACSLELTLAIAWGVALQLQQQLHLDLRLKWPNDLVLQGRKLGGVLLQSRSTGHSVTAVVAGLGLNINNATPDTGIALQESLGRPLHLAAVAALALQGMENGFLAWQEGGLESVLPSYEHLMLHRQLAIALGGDRGAILGITPTGLLRIGTASGVRTLAPGAISLGYPICNPQSQDR